MPSNQSESYRTKDLAEASMLVVKGQKLVTVVKEAHTCWFVFRNKSECEKLANAYFYNDVPVHARAFHETMSRLKGRIFAMS